MAPTDRSITSSYWLSTVALYCMVPR